MEIMQFRLLKVVTLPVKSKIKKSRYNKKVLHFKIVKCIEMQLCNLTRATVNKLFCRIGILVFSILTKDISVSTLSIDTTFDY